MPTEELKVIERQLSPAQREPKHHPIDAVWLREVTQASRAYARGDTNITEFRQTLKALRVKHNRVVNGR